MAETDSSADVARTWQSDNAFLQQVDRIKVYAVRGSIATLVSDAVISSDNESGEMISRTAMALKTLGGGDIESESMSGRHALGDAWRTNPGKLHVKHVIHIALLDSNNATNVEVIRKAFANSLLVAEDHNIESIVYPALGIGRGGFPTEESGRIVKAGLSAHIQRCPEGSIRSVGFVLYSPEDYNRFTAGYRSWNGSES